MAEWISVREAAQLIEYHPDHLRVLLRQGKINAKKVVSVWLVDKKSLIQYLHRMKTKGEKRGPKS
jgi:excisionase family DNA binding protein